MKDIKTKFKDILEKFKMLDSKRKRNIIIISAIVVILVIITIISSIMLSSSVGSAGKIAGNLNNGGFATQKGSNVYISNTLIQTEGSTAKGLYKISNKDVATLIAEDEYIKSINYYKGNLYYLAINKNDEGIYVRQIVKIKPNGENKQILVDNIETDSIGNSSLNVSGGWIYYLNGESKLEKVKVNGEKRQQVSEQTIESFQISGKYIYYTTSDDEFKRMKKDGSAVEKIETALDSFQVVSGDVYYISKANGYLMKYNIKDKTETEVVGRKIKIFNVYKKVIYYAVNEGDEQAIYSIKINGKNNQKIVDLDSVNVYMCVIDDWIYYVDQVEDSPYYYAIYKIRTNGKDKEKVNI